MRKRAVISIFWVLLVTMPSALAEPLDLADDLAALVKDSPVPALAAAAVLDGEVVSQGAAGVRKVGESIGVTMQDQFHVGSCTKSMTAVLAAMMVEDGKLDWETTVAEVFPKVVIHPGFREVTLEQLLSHTGGAPGEIAGPLWKSLWEAKGSAREQRRQLVAGVLKSPPVYQPGQGQEYSNAGFAIAGAMIETRCGKSFEELLKARLFGPLGMISAGFRAPATPGMIDHPYGHVRGEEKVVAFDPEPTGDNPRAVAPAGAVHCSVGDLARDLSFHLSGDGGGLLSAEAMARLHRPVKEKGFALGWVVTQRDWAAGRVLTHAGTNTMFYAVMWVAPEKDFAAIALCNLGGKMGLQKCDEAIAFLVKKHLREKRGEEN